MMVWEEQLQRLSVIADGESEEVERGEMEAALMQNPALRKSLADFARLQAAARGEEVPDAWRTAADSDAAPPDELWPLIAERLPPHSEELVGRLETLAAAESVPEVAPERFDEVYQHVKLRIGASNDAAPRVDTQKWNRVWKKVSARTVAVKAEVPAAKQPPAKIVPITLPERSRAWYWAVGFGAAASILLALSLKTVLPKIPSVNWASGAQAISVPTDPETQDEHYGVRLRYPPGGVDPVVTLYYKNPPPEESQSGGNDDEKK